MLIDHASGHRRSQPKPTALALLPGTPAEIEVGDVDVNRRQVLEFLGEGWGQPGEPLHEMSNREIAPKNKNPVV